MSARQIAYQDLLTAGVPFPDTFNLNPLFMPKTVKMMANARANIARGKILVCGTSITAGHQTVSSSLHDRKKAWFRGLALALGTKRDGTPMAEADCFFGDAGDGTANVPTLLDDRIAVGGFGDGAIALAGRTFQSTARANSAFVFTPGVSFDTVDRYYIGINAGGGCKIGINVGGSELDAFAVENVNLLKHRTTSIGSTATALNITNASTTDVTIYLAGLDVYTTTNKNISVLGAGWAGSTSADWNTKTSGWSAFNAIAAVGQDLTLFEIGTNDWKLGGNIPLATYITNMQALITQAKTVGDVGLVNSPASNPALDSTQVLQQQYVDAMCSLCLSNNIPLFSIPRRWGTWDQANALGFMSDTYHPLFVGAQSMGDCVARGLLAL